MSSYSEQLYVLFVGSQTYSGPKALTEGIISEEQQMVWRVMDQHDRQSNIDFWGQWIKRGTKLEFNYVSGEERNIATEQLPSLIRGATCSLRISAKAKLKIYHKFLS